MLFKPGQVPADIWLEGAATLRSTNFLENLVSAGAKNRKRSRASQIRIREKSESNPSANPESGDLLRKKVLLIIESEGAVFDSLSAYCEHAYVPAFTACFSMGQDALLCGHIWRTVALTTRLRGNSPFVILAASLRLLNKKYPSVRRAAIIKTLDAFLASDEKNLLALADSPAGNPGRIIADWYSMTHGVIEREPPVPRFARAQSFLESLPVAAPSADVLVHSTMPEFSALGQWEMAGMGSLFRKIAGRERGSILEYLRMVVTNGFDKIPILAVGTTRESWLAAQSVGARFYPIIPSREEESWAFLEEIFFPAFMKGTASSVSGDSYEFIRMMTQDLSLAAILEEFENVYLA